MRIMQGDAYYIPFEIELSGVAVTDADVDDVEITIGTTSKTYGDSDLTYESGEWRYPLTQAETFAFPASSLPVQIRVKPTSGDVIGIDLGGLDVTASISKVEL